MLFKYFKGNPGFHVVAYRNGKVVREGRGISFFYLPVTTTLNVVPVTSMDAQFAIKETTSNYQDVAVQGSLTYRIIDARKASDLLDFSFDHRTGKYRSEDPQKLEARIVNAVQGQARPLLKMLALEDVLTAANRLATEIKDKLTMDTALIELGVIVEGIYIVQITPTPELKKALEADYRESLNRRADLAIYSRRAAALEEERKLKQSELDTDINIEEGRSALVTKQAENSLTLAEAEAKAAEMKIDPYAKLPAPALLALALKEWAASNPSIGQLNLTPDMLTGLAGWMTKSGQLPKTE